MEPRIEKIKFKGGSILIAYKEESKKTGLEERTTKEYNDPPQKAFMTARDEMIKYFRNMIELPMGLQQNLHIEEFNIGWRDEFVTLKIKGSRSLEKSKGAKEEKTTEFSYDMADEKDQTGKKNRMSKECYEALMDLVGYAWKYVRGERAQQELDLVPDSPGVEMDENDKEELSVQVQ